MGDVVSLDRSSWRSRGAAPARARVESIRRLSKTQLKLDAELYPYPADVVRPATRGDCLPGGCNSERPCPFVSCLYHLALDVHPENGSIKENFPDRELDALLDTCALDAADRDGLTLDDTAARINITRERARQVIDAALNKHEDELLAIAADNDIGLAASAQRTLAPEPKPEPALLPDVDREAMLEAARAAGAARGPALGALAHDPSPAPRKRGALLITAAPDVPIRTHQPPHVGTAVPVVESTRKTPVARREVKCAREGCEHCIPVIANRRFCSTACHDLAAEDRRRVRRAAALGRPPLREQRRICKGCQTEFAPRSGNERYCEACKGVTGYETYWARRKELGLCNCGSKAEPGRTRCAGCGAKSRERERRRAERLRAATPEGTTMTQLPMIDCEHNLGTMQTRMCGRRWARANGLPVVNSFTRTFEQQLHASPCVGCVHGEARIHHADRIPNAVRSALPQRPHPNPPPPPRAVPTSPPTAPVEKEETQVARAYEPSPKPAKFCPCGAPINRIAGTVGRLPDRCNECRSSLGTASSKPSQAPDSIVGHPARSSSPEQGLAARIVPALDAIKQDVAHLQVELDRLKAGANTLAAVASLPAPYPEVA